MFRSVHLVAKVTQRSGAGKPGQGVDSGCHYRRSGSLLRLGNRAKRDAAMISRQKSRSLGRSGQSARIAFSQDQVPRCGNQSIDSIAKWCWKSLPDPRQPTVSGQIVEDIKKSVTFPQPYFLLRPASKNKDGICLQGLRMVLRDTPERFAL